MYVAADARGRGVGRSLLTALVREAEAAELWTLQASVFPAENHSSLALHALVGFRTVGVRERIGLMTYGPCAGRWRDTLLLERRTAG